MFHSPMKMILKSIMNPESDAHTRMNLYLLFTYVHHTLAANHIANHVFLIDFAIR